MGSTFSRMASKVAFMRLNPSYSETHEDLIFIDDIACIYIDTGSKYTILYSHGNGCDIGECYSFLKKLSSIGYNVIAYDYYGYGLSGEEQTTEENTYYCIERVYNHIIKYINSSDIILYGHSIGTGPTCRLSSKIDCKCVILESPYLSISSMINSNVGYIMQRLNPENDMFSNYHNIKRCNNTVFILHGVEDKVIPVEHSRSLSKLNNVVLIEIEGAGHNDISFFEEFDNLLNGINTS